jgi:hypothetical protein
VATRLTFDVRVFGQKMSKLAIVQDKVNIQLPVNLTRAVIGHTALMKNDIYYDTYCIAINTIFASILPFIALMFFNVRIALKLRYGRKVIIFTVYLSFVLWSVVGPLLK